MSNLTEINNRLTRLENNLREQTCSSVSSPTVNTTDAVDEFSVVDAVFNINNRLNKLENNKRACARATVAEGLPLTLIINKTASFSVLVRDCGGYDLSTGGDNVTATLTCVDYPSLVSPQPTVVDNGDSSYQVSLSSECSGNNLVSVSINRKTTDGSYIDLVVGPDKRLYATDGIRELISIFSMVDRSLFHQITGTPPLPRGIGFDQGGNLHVGSSTGPQNIISVYTPSGVLVRSYTPPSVLLVDGIFIDRVGNRLISDRTTSKLIITDKNNNLISKLKGFANAVITPNGNVWVTQSNHNKVFIYSE